MATAFVKLNEYRAICGGPRADSTPKPKTVLSACLMMHLLVGNDLPGPLVQLPARGTGNAAY